MRDNRERAEFIHQTLASGDISDSSNWGIICNALDEAEARGRNEEMERSGGLLVALKCALHRMRENDAFEMKMCQRYLADTIAHFEETPLGSELKEKD